MQVQTNPSSGVQTYNGQYNQSVPIQENNLMAENVNVDDDEKEETGCCDCGPDKGKNC